MLNSKVNLNKVTMYLDHPSKRLHPFSEISYVERAVSELHSRHLPRSSLTTNHSRKPKQQNLKSSKSPFHFRRNRDRLWLPQGRVCSF